MFYYRSTIVVEVENYSRNDLDAGMTNDMARANAATKTHTAVCIIYKGAVVCSRVKKCPGIFYI